MQHYGGHTAAVGAVDFHASGSFLLSSSDDATIKVRKRSRLACLGVAHAALAACSCGICARATCCIPHMGTPGPC
ncbi:MAG: hypothetical protein ACK4ZJ_17600, partial [Allorhizobium sp.]